MRAPLCILCIVFGVPASAQRRAIDLSYYGGDSGRSGWEKSDSSITHDNVKDFQLVLKRKLESGGGPRSLTPPVIIGNLISYKGFKELGFVAGGSDTIWSIDVDTDRIFWTKHFETVGKRAGCPGVATAVPSLTPPSNFGARPRPGGAAPANRGILGTGAFGAPRPAFTLSSDGKLHLLNTSNGADLVPAIPFIPPGAESSSLAISDGVIYTTTTSRCGGAPAGIWALDLNSIDPTNPAAKPALASFRTEGAEMPSVGGVAFGSDGTVYAQTGDGASKWSRSLLALTPKDLSMKQSFSAPPGKSAVHGSPVSPVVFTYSGRDLIATAGTDGALYLYDSQSLAPLDQTAPLVTSGAGTWGGLSTWLDPAGTRWILAPVWGAINPELKLGGTPAHGSIVAFRVEERTGKPVLTPAWVSRDLVSPEPPAITSGVVFALSAGDRSAHATLYAMDALTGKEMYSTGGQVTSSANLTGITLANGRVFFTTVDGTLWAFGIALER